MRRNFFGGLGVFGRGVEVKVGGEIESGRRRGSSAWLNGVVWV